MEYNNNYYQQPNQGYQPQGNGNYQPPVNNNLPMSFHNFYKWYLVIIGALSIFTAIVSVSNDSGAALSTTSFLTAALNIVCGICLMKMMSLGKTLQSIVNVLGIISGAGCCLLSVLCMLGGGMLASFIDDAAGSISGGIFIIVGIVILIYAVAKIVINACILKYYKKRKHLFS